MIQEKCDRVLLYRAGKTFLTDYMVGKAGIEQVMELQLQEKKIRKQMIQMDSH